MAGKTAQKITLDVIVSLLNELQEDAETADNYALADRIQAVKTELSTGWVKADDLMGVADLAAFFDIGATTVSGWYMHRERGMPDPVAYISNKIPCWDGAAVVSWWINWVPRKGAKAGTLPWERERAERRARGEAV